jgi:hypothetical protein
MKAALPATSVFLSIGIAMAGGSHTSGYVTDFSEEAVPAPKQRRQRLSSKPPSATAER